MDAAQIYTLVNALASQAIGASDIEITDLQGLISLGDKIVSSEQNTEAFLNSLYMQTAKTVISFRKYDNKFLDMVKSDIEWGGIVQKIKADMPEAIADPSPELVEGQSVDPYKVMKGKVHQKLFYTRAPYTIGLTTQRRWLKEAFTNPTAMATFLNARTGEVQNKLNLTMENLGRTCLCNMIAELAGTGREVKLVTLYNASHDAADAVTAENCFNSPEFLRFAIKKMKDYMKLFTDMSQIFNDGTTTRHTPFEEQRFRVWSEFESALETSVQWAAFNENYVRLSGYNEYNYLQSIKEGERTKINVKRASDGQATEVSNIVAVLYDTDSAGTFREYEDTLTTPVNALGQYYNTFWHEQQLWFNDLSENCVIFTLN